MRKYYIDNIRWITIVLVVIYHVIYLFNGVAPELVVGAFHEKQYQDGIQYLLYPWFMVILFILAGMCSRFYLERHTVKEFVRSRTRKLLVPSTIGLFVWGWVQGYVNMSITDAFRQMQQVPRVILYFIMVLSGTGVLWFIQLLWLFSMLLAFIKGFERGKLYELCGRANIIALLLLAIPVFVSAQILNTPVITVYRFGIYGFTFFLGYFLFSHDEVVEILKRFCVWLIIAAVVSGITFLCLHFGENYAVKPVVNSVSAMLFAYLACLAIIGGMKRWGDRTSALAQYMSKKSFGLYVFHYLPISAAAYALHKYTQLSALPSYLLTGIAGFAGGLLLYEIISRLPVIRWCVLGIKKESADD